MATISTTFRLVDNVSSPMSHIENSVRNTTRGFESMAGKLVAVNSALDLLGKGIQVVKQIGSAFGQAVSDAGEYQSLLANLTVATGDAIQAQKEFADLKEFASKTPFDLPGVVKASTMFHAVGMEAEKIIPTIRMLGDASAGNNDYFNRMAMNYMQIMASGKATMQDMRQFAYMGLPVMQMMQDMGITGQATAEQVQQMFIKMTSAGGQFYNSMNLNAGTLSGTNSNLRDTLQQVSATIGNTMLPLITDLSRAMSGFIESVQQTKAFQAFIDKMNSMVAKVKSNLNSIVATIIQVGTVGTAVITALGVAWMAFHWQSTLVLMVIINIVRALYDLNASAIESANSMGELSNRVALAGQSFGKVIGFVSTLFGGLMNIVYNVIAVIHNSFASLGEFLVNVFRHPLKTIVSGLLDFASNVVELIGAVGSAIDLVFGSNFSESLGNASRQIQAFKNEKFAPDVQFERMELKNITGILAGTRQGGEYGYEVAEMLENSLNAISNNTEGMNTALSTQEGLPLDSNGAVKVSIQNDKLKIDNEWSELMYRKAVEQYKIKYNQVTPQLNIGNFTVNEPSDVDIIMDKIASTLSEATDSSLY